MLAMTRFRNESGSLPLALLAVLMVTGLVVVVTSTMVMGQQQTRRDANFEDALQAADAGLNRLVPLVESEQHTGSFSVSGPGYSATATLDEAAGHWELTSTGTMGTTSRTVQSLIPLDSVFSHNPLGRAKITLLGNNWVDSYRSGAFVSRTDFQADPYSSYLDANNNVTRKEGRGFLATEGPLDLNGQTFDNSESGAQIYYTKHPEFMGGQQPVDSGATGECIQVPAACTSWVEGNTGRLHYYRDRVKVRSLRFPRQPTQHFDGAAGTPLPAGASVFRSMNLTTDTVVEGTPENPTIVYVTGEVTAEAHARINFEMEGSIRRPRPSGSLLIYVGREGSVLFPTNVQLAGGIYAPESDFVGGSQGEIWGGLVANNISTNGGWKFHYDVTMSELPFGNLKAMDWVELGG